MFFLVLFVDALGPCSLLKDGFVAATDDSQYFLALPSFDSLPLEFFSLPSVLSGRKTYY